ncbi:hypothetical protein [Neolewinella persica]|uniref:hypothetical protein n=1 Tax=Neolewinella persica TaxID=70998 RepID=UPI00039D1E1B|nr:hypothetical protein [Neolewinella persica]
MKYFFAAIFFWILGYVIPSFPVFLQYIIGVLVILFLSTVLFYLIDTRVYARMLHEQGDESIPDQFL